MGISALTGDGVGALLAEIDARLQAKNTMVTELSISAADGQKMAWLHEHGQVLSKQLEGEEWHVSVRLTPQKLAQFQHRYAKQDALH